MATFSALSLEMTKGQQHFILKWICFSPSFTRWGLKDSSQHEGSNTDLHWEPTNCETPGTGSLIWGMALLLEGTGATSQIRKRRHRFLIRLKTRASKPKDLFPHFTLWSVCFRKLVHQAQLLWRTVWSVLKKKKNNNNNYRELPYDPTIPPLGIYPENKATLQPNGHSSTIYKSQDTEAT